MSLTYIKKPASLNHVGPLGSGRSLDLDLKYQIYKKENLGENMMDMNCNLMLQGLSWSSLLPHSFYDWLGVFYFFSHPFCGLGQRLSLDPGCRVDQCSDMVLKFPFPTIWLVGFASNMNGQAHLLGPSLHTWPNHFSAIKTFLETDSTLVSPFLFLKQMLQSPEQMLQLKIVFILNIGLIGWNLTQPHWIP